VQWTIFRGAADRRFARESGQRNRLDRLVVGSMMRPADNFSAPIAANEWREGRLVLRRY